MQMFYPMYHHKHEEDHPYPLYISAKHNQMSPNFSRILCYGDVFFTDRNLFREAFGYNISAAIWGIV